jgi:AcrR family transcriptional regulator
MSRMSTPYETGGRSAQKRRTREALVAAARDLLATGVTPTVEGAAEVAGISRTTAYRYFPNKRALLLAAHPEVAAASMLPPDAPADPSARLEAVVRNFTEMIKDTETQQRAMLRLSLEPNVPERAELPLRQGRAVAWITEAIEDLRGELGDAGLRQLVLGIRAATGIEALVWLVDIGGLSSAEAVELMRWSAHALLERARTDPPPAPGAATPDGQAPDSVTSSTSKPSRSSR